MVCALCPHVEKGETVIHAESMLGTKIQIKHERLRFDLVFDDCGVSSKVKEASITSLTTTTTSNSCRMIA